MNVPKRERDRLFQLGVQTRIAELEAEIAELRSYALRAVPRVAEPAKHEAASRRMKKWWAGQRGAKKRTKPSTKPGRRTMTDEQKRRHSEIMKKAWAMRSPEARLRQGRLMARARRRA
jgi:hypothetical protein